MTPVETFLEVVKRSGLVTESALTGHLAKLTDEQKSSPQTICRSLLESNLVTRWQAEKLLKGKHQGFFLGKYRLLRLLGRGGMSAVYLARHNVMNRECAIKVLPLDKVDSQSYLERFILEAQAVASLDHPNIVRAYDVDSCVQGKHEVHYLVMEYVEGKNLHEVVQEEGPLEVKRAAEYIRQGALGLAHAHKANLTHRDVKPGNFLLTNDGVVKLLDLGLARTHNPDEEYSVTVAHDERVLGTADYLAPEQAVNSHNVDARADIYSLGCTFYYLLTKEPPFSSGTLTQRLLAHQSQPHTPLKSKRDDIPDELSGIVDKMLAKKPEDRFQTAQEIADRLGRFLGEKEDSNQQKQVKQQAIAETKPELGSFIESLATMEADRPSGVTKKRADRKSDIASVSVLESETDVITSDRTSDSYRGSKIKRPQRNLLWILGVVAFLAVVAVYMTVDRDESPEEPVAVTPDPDQTEAKPPREITGPQVTVGKDGDFSNVSQAVEYILAHLNGVDAVKITEIRVQGGEQIQDAIVIDNSGLGKFPRGVKLIGESPKPTLRSHGSSPVLWLKDLEGFIVDNINIDGAGQEGVRAEGYVVGTRILRVDFQNCSTAVHGLGVNGLAGQDFIVERCTVHGNDKNSRGMKFEPADTSDTRRIAIRDCSFIGPLEAGLQITGTFWDGQIVGNRFHDLDTGIELTGSQSLNAIQFLNNTFHKLQRGIVFSNGPDKASSGISFGQNLFVAVQANAIQTRDGVDLQALAKGGSGVRNNWSTSADTGTLDVFQNNGKKGGVEVKFVSTDPTNANFLKPSDQQLRTSAKSPIGGRAYIGAVSP